MRAAKALSFFTSGYCQTVEDVVGEGVFNEETSNDMVVVRNIDIHSLCEHHLVPFSGKVHIAYIPNGKILGLSKLARIANLFARRLQVQERLTRQIATAVMETASALGVGVTIEARFETYLYIISLVIMLKYIFL
jgi:GTP cyclohydrolase I